MKNNHILKTSNGNCYYFSYLDKKIYLLHPIMADLLQSKEKNKTFHGYYEEKIKYFNKYHLLDNEIYNQEIKYLTAKDVKKALADIRQVTLELTDLCNLQCRYCCYGDLYDNFEPRNGEKMKFQTVKSILDYLFSLGGISSKERNKREVNIGFYGGGAFIEFFTY